MQNESEVDSIQFFVFLINCIRHLQSYLLQQQSYLLQQSLLQLVNQFQRYVLKKDCKNNRKQRIICFVWLYLKSVYTSSDSFCIFVVIQEKIKMKIVFFQCFFFFQIVNDLQWAEADAWSMHAT